MPYRFNQLLLLLPLLTETTFKTMKLVRKRTWKTLRNPVYREISLQATFVWVVLVHIRYSFFRSWSPYRLVFSLFLEEYLQECITHFNSRSIASHRQVVLWCQLKAVTVKGRLNYFEFQPRYNPKDFCTTYLFRWLAARKERGCCTVADFLGNQSSMRRTSFWQERRRQDSRQLTKSLLDFDIQEFQLLRGRNLEIGCRIQ